MVFNIVQSKKYVSFLVITLYILIAVFYFWVAIHLGTSVTDGGPDEGMRALLPLAISNGNLLPSGYDKDVIYSLGNWSYAFYPQMFCAYCSAFFMFLAKLVGLQTGYIYMSGRIASIGLSIVTLYFTSNVVYEVVYKKTNCFLSATRCRILCLCFLAFWPQYAFISSYMNNEIGALCGLSIMLYAISIGISKGWDMKHVILLSIGIVISALSYWNVYGFILLSIIIYLCSIIKQAIPKKRKVKLVVTSILLCAFFTFPFFIVNFLRYGDVLGMSTFKMNYQKWLDAGGQILQHPYSEGLISLIFKSDYCYTTYLSFIGCLGYMTIFIPFSLSIIYAMLATIGVGSFMVTWNIHDKESKARVLVIGSVVASFITVTLSIYYSLATDYQPQGRYIIYILLPLAIGATLGLNEIIRRLKIHPILVYISIFIYSLICILFFAISATNYGWSGVL